VNYEERASHFVFVNYSSITVIYQMTLIRINDAVAQQLYSRARYTPLVPGGKQSLDAATRGHLMKAAPDLAADRSTLSSEVNRQRPNPVIARRGTLYEVKKNCVSVDRSELFAGLPSHVSEEVVASARTKDVASGDVIHFVGDPIKQVLLLTDGCVKSSQLSQGGREAILRLAVPGEVISELVLAPGGTHSSTAQALQDCKVLAWDSTTFETVLVCFPGLRRNAQRILERRLAELQSRFLEVSTKTASPRLAHGLVHLMDHCGRRVNSHVEIDISQEVLGQLTAMSSHEVCKLLSRWKGQGLVKLRRGTIEIHSVPCLVGLCQVG